MINKQAIVYSILGAICIFSFIVTFSVHSGYKIPYHVDEWTHAGYVVEIDKTGHVPDYWPFDGEMRKTGFDLESGFHIFHYTLFKLTGIDLMLLTIFLPALTAVITSLMAFIFMRMIFDEKIGLISAFAVATIKTNVTLLGPMFFVPVAFAFPLMLLTAYLFLSAVESSNKKYFLLCAVSFFALALYHPTSAMAMVIPFAAYSLMRREFILKNWKFLVFGAVLLFGIFLFYTPTFFQNPYALADFFNRRAVYSGFSDESGVEIFFFLPSFAGPLITVLSAVGAYICLTNKNKRDSFIVLMFLANLVWILTYYYFNFSYFIPYRRALLYVAEMMYLLAAVGIAGIISFAYNLLKKRMSLKLLIAIIVICCVPAVIYQTATLDKFTKLFYTEISDEDYNNILFFNSIDEDATIMCLPQVCHTIFPITGRHVVSTMMSIDSKSRDSVMFFDSNCTVKQDILNKYSVEYVYSGKNMSCSFLNPVSANIYRII